MTYLLTACHTFEAPKAPQATRLSVGGKVVFTIFELNVDQERTAAFSTGGPAMQTYEVRANWDPEASVWWAESDDVPGLVAETRTHEEMVAELRLLIPELLDLNLPDRPREGIIVRLTSQQVEDICYA